LLVIIYNYTNDTQTHERHEIKLFLWLATNPAKNTCGQHI